METSIPVRYIIRSAANHFKVPLSQVLSHSRKADAVRPRHIAMYIARKTSHWSLPYIAIDFGRDYTTVKYACDMIESNMTEETQLECQKVYNGARELYLADLAATKEAATSGGVNFFEAKGNTQ